MPLQIRRGTAAERTGLTTPLVIGELLYVTDQGRLFIGDGTNLGDPDSAGNASQGGKGLIITGFTAEDAQDAAATLFSNGTHSNIVFSYNDNANALSAQIDLSTYTGNITVVNGIVDADFQGSVFADNSTLLVDAVNGSIPYAVLNGAPSQVSQFANDVGYITVADISDGTVTIDVNNTGDLQGSVFGDDSTLLVDAVNSTIPASVITGTFTGDVKGSVFADDSTMLVDGTNGRIVAPVFGNIFTNNIDSEDSSAIFVATAMTFSSDIVVENEIISNNIINTGGITTNGLVSSNITTNRLVSSKIIPNSNRLIIDRELPNTRTTISINSNNERSIIRLQQTSELDLSLGETTNGSIFFSREDISGDKATAIIVGRQTSMLLGVSITGNYDDTLFTTVKYSATGARFGIRTVAPDEALDVRGNAVVSGFLKPGTFTSIERDAIPTPAVGIMIYNSTTNKFQGYQNSGGVTLEWVDLS